MYLEASELYRRESHFVRVEIQRFGFRGAYSDCWLLDEGRLSDVPFVAAEETAQSFKNIAMTLSLSLVRY